MITQQSPQSKRRSSFHSVQQGYAYQQGRTSPVGHLVNPYGTSPRSPTHKSEAPLTTEEITRLAEALPYACKCGKKFRSRAQILAHTEKQQMHVEANVDKGHLECPRNCGRKIADLEDMVDHLDRRHFILQDIRRLFAPYLERPNTPRTNGGASRPASPLGFASRPASPLGFTSRPASPLGKTHFIKSETPQPDLTDSALDAMSNLSIAAETLAYNQSKFSVSLSLDSPKRFGCGSPTPSVLSTSSVTTNYDSDASPTPTLSKPPALEELRPYTCKCGMRFRKDVDLENHLRTPGKSHFDATVYKFTCPSCDKKYPTSEILRKHADGEHSIKFTPEHVHIVNVTVVTVTPPVSPNPDGTALLNPLPPDLVERYVKLGPFRCKCGGSFATLANLNGHISHYQKKLPHSSDHADVTGASRYMIPCLLCNEFSFSTPKQLKAHLASFHKTEYIK